MKKFLILIAFLASAVTMNAQTRSLNLELLGSFGMAGINYDARFKGNNGFGYSVGMGYGYSNSGIDFPNTAGNDGVTHELSVPVELNYLFGQNNSHFVLGAGAMAGLSVNEAAKKPVFAYNLFADVAYRYQKPKGFAFAVGFKPNLLTAFWPYISIGYSF